MAAKNVRVADAQYLKLKAIARARGTSVSREVRDAVDAHARAHQAVARQRAERLPLGA